MVLGSLLYVAALRRAGALGLRGLGLAGQALAWYATALSPSTRLRHTLAVPLQQRQQLHLLLPAAGARRHLAQQVACGEGLQLPLHAARG